MRYRRWIHESIADFLLGHDADGIGTTDGDARQGCTGGFEGVFHLIQSSLRTENGYVMIVIGIATHSSIALYALRIEIIIVSSVSMEIKTVD
mmetsp:Transcript_18752/g.28488  ORF Transcript_18752/g.28488 Transcript_18752/m.28488 type:complete len:92 (-) Transcript_18752:52-327(-)